MANPKLENGYTKIANELLEAIYRSQFKASQFKILLFIIRYTYGFQREKCKLSNNFIANGTNSHRQTVLKEINQLIADNVLIEVAPPSFSEPRTLAVNKNYTSWRNHYQVVSTLPGSEKTLPGSLQTTSPGSLQTTQEIKTINKTLNKKERNAVAENSDVQPYADLTDEEKNKLIAEYEKRYPGNDYYRQQVEQGNDPFNLLERQ